MSIKIYFCVVLSQQFLSPSFDTGADYYDVINGTPAALSEL